jgi:hypothetical protein
VEALTPAAKRTKGTAKGTRKPKAKGRPLAAAAPAASPWKTSGEALYFGADPGSPAVGDLRVTFSKVPPTDVSVIARQSGKSFGPYQTEAGNALEMLTEGTVSAPAMFAEAERSNTTTTWLLRVGGFLLMLFGMYSVFRPLAVVADVVPFFGSLVSMGVGVVAFVIAAPLSLLTIAVAWIFYRPLLGIGLLLAALAIFIGIKKLSGGRAAPARMRATG